MTDELRQQGVATGASVNLFSDLTAHLGGPLSRTSCASSRPGETGVSIATWSISRIGKHRPLLGSRQHRATRSTRETGSAVLYTRQTYLKPDRNASALVPPGQHVDRGRCLPDLPGALQLRNHRQSALRRARESRGHRLSAEPTARRDPTEHGGAFDGQGKWRGAAQFRSSAHQDGRRGGDWLLPGRVPELVPRHQGRVAALSRIRERGDRRTRGHPAHVLDGAPSFVIGWTTPVRQQGSVPRPRLSTCRTPCGRRRRSR